MDVDEAGRLSGANPDFGLQDLYEAIAKGDFPTWSMSIQVMTFEQAENWKFNPFDLTKVNRVYIQNVELYGNMYSAICLFDDYPTEPNFEFELLFGKSIV